MRNFFGLLRRQTAGLAQRPGSDAQIVSGAERPPGTGQEVDTPTGPRPFTDPSFRVCVLFTGMENTLAALGKAEQLASGLDAHILLIVPLVVPYQLPLAQPPVSPDFLARRLCRVVRRESAK